MNLIASYSTSLRSVLVGLLVAGALSACSSMGDDYGRRQDVVYVPSTAQAVDRVRWDHIRNFRPLNERMILMEVRRRPHLLVLSQACVGLRRSSVMVLNRRTAHFDPHRDGIGIINQGPISTTSTCVPDALYALDEDDVDALMAAI